MSNLATQLDFTSPAALAVSGLSIDTQQLSVGVPGSSAGFSVAPPAVSTVTSSNGAIVATASQDQIGKGLQIQESVKRQFTKNPLQDSKALRNHAGRVEQKTGQQQLQKAPTGAPTAPRNIQEKIAADLTKHGLKSSLRVYQRNKYAALNAFSNKKTAAQTEEKPAQIKFATQKVVSVGNDLLNDLTRRAARTMLKSVTASNFASAAVFGITSAINLTKPESYDHSTPEDGAVNAKSKPTPKIKAAQPALMQEPSQPQPGRRRHQFPQPGMAA